MSDGSNAVTAVDPGVKPAAVVDNVNDHTPDPETPKAVEHVPDPPRSDKEGLSELSEITERLAATVTVLTETVTVLAQAVTGTAHDESPAKGAWYARGSQRRES
jgi:hypothetical protein